MECRARTQVSLLAGRKAIMIASCDCPALFFQSCCLFPLPSQPIQSSYRANSALSLHPTLLLPEGISISSFKKNRETIVPGSLFKNRFDIPFPRTREQWLGLTGLPVVRTLRNRHQPDSLLRIADWPLWKPDSKHGRLFYIHLSSKIPPLLLHEPFLSACIFDQVVGAEGQSLDQRLKDLVWRSVSPPLRLFGNRHCSQAVKLSPTPPLYL